MTEAVFLSAEERERFAMWCAFEAASDEAISKQAAESVPGRIGETVARNKLAEARAKRLVGRVLLSAEKVEL